MPYRSLEIDRENFTIMGVHFPDLETLNSVADAIGSNMFEGFEPTAKGIEIIRDYIMNEITLPQLVQFAKANVYAK